MTRWRPAPLEVAVDLDHGGRWTSLASSDREWLWSNPDPCTAAARQHARPGDAFVDAGGIEECFPTINGMPDHGDAWARPWATDELGRGTVSTSGGLQLARTIRVTDGVVDVAYRISGTRGTPFLHAVHALLELSPDARWRADGTRRLLSATASALPLEELGPDDGTAVSAVVEGASWVEVVDGSHRLRMEWDVPAACGLLIWRNLGGWPSDRPYRSIGIEPLVGTHRDLVSALELEERGLGPPVPRIAADGTFEWSLRVRGECAHHRVPRATKIDAEA